MKLPELFIAEAVEETDEQINLLKEQFAALLLKEPSEPFKVALIIYPDDTNKALKVANTWPNDPVVKTFQQSLVESEGEMSFLPSEAADIQETRKFALTLLERGDPSFVQMWRTYMESRGRIGKAQQIAINTNTSITHNVMLVKDYGTDENWESNARTQQAKLKREALADIIDVSPSS